MSEQMQSNLHNVGDWGFAHPNPKDCFTCIYSLGQPPLRITLEKPIAGCTQGKAVSRNPMACTMTASRASTMTTGTTELIVLYFR